MSLQQLIPATARVSQAHQQLTRRTRMLVGAVVGALTSLLFLIPAPAFALLKTAAEKNTPKEGKNDPTFKVLTEYFNDIAGFAVWCAIPAATLGVVAAGGLFMAGNRRASSVAISTIGGLAVIISAKTIAG